MKVGGAERYCIELLKRVSQIPKYDVHLFCHKSEVDIPKVRIHKVAYPKWPRSFRQSWFANSVKKNVAKVGIEILHSHDRIWDADVISLHGLPHSKWATEVLNRKPNGFDRNQIKVEETMMKRSPTCLAVSSIVKQAYQDAYPNLNDHLQIMHPCAELSSLKKKEELRRSARKNRRIDDKELVLLFVGMNSRHKGLIKVIDTLAKLKKDGCAAKLWVVGDGNESFFRSRVEEKGLANDVHFFGVVSESLTSFYAGADVFLLPSQSDTFAMVVADALAYGCVTLVSDQVGAKDIIDIHGGGVVLGLDKFAEEASQHLLNWYLKKSKSVPETKEAEKYVVSHDWESLTQSCLDIYEKVAKRKLSK